MSASFDPEAMEEALMWCRLTAITKALGFTFEIDPDTRQISFDGPDERVMELVDRLDGVLNFE
jgi:hypothetical protein